MQPDARLSLDQRGSDTVFRSATYDANAAAAAAAQIYAQRPSVSRSNHSSTATPLTSAAPRIPSRKRSMARGQRAAGDCKHHQQKRNSAYMELQPAQRSPLRLTYDHRTFSQYLRHQRTPALARVQPIPNNDQLTRLASRHKTALAPKCASFPAPAPLSAPLSPLNILWLTPLLHRLSAIPGGDDEARRHNSPSPAPRLTTSATTSPHPDVRMTFDQAHANP